MIVVRGIPIYWGIETEPQDRSFWTYSVLNEVLPPYRQSTYGLRMRVSHRHWLHVGKYLYDKTPGRYGIPATLADIRKWGMRATQEASPSAGSDQDGRVVRPGPDSSPGVGGDEGQRAAPWPDAPGTGPGVDPGRAGVEHGASTNGDTCLAAEGGN